MFGGGEAVPEIIDLDVLVVGGGGAALRAAIEAHAAGARTGVAVKGQFGVIGLRGGGATGSGTAADQRGYWPVTADGCVLESAFDDIVQLGLGMADPNLVRIVCEEAPATMRNLMNLGVQMDSRRLHNGSGTLRPGRTARAIVPTLSSALRRAGCALFEQTMITSLLKIENACVGAVGIREDTSEVIVFRAGAVVLGTGGAAQMFKHNVHPSCITGDGYALAFRVGAELLNLEFMQTFLGTVFPTINNISNWLWAEDIRVYNAKGEEFLANYLPAGATLGEARAQAVQHNPFSTRDSLSRYLAVAMMKEVMAGRGTEREGIYFDLTSPNVRVPRERSSWLTYRGIDWTCEPFEATVYAMCSHGGMRIDGHAQTTVAGLYAVGECSAACYGADRHAGHMMAASQVFGARAGRQAAGRTIGLRRVPLPREALAAEEARIASLAKAKGSRRPKQILTELKQSAWNNLLAVRHAAGIRSFLSTVEELRKTDLPEVKVEHPDELVEVLELENMLLFGQMQGASALMRSESRGGHYREDFPDQDDANWLKCIRVRQVDGEPVHDTLALHPAWKSRPGDMFDDQWG